MQDRIRWIDDLKGLAIVLIVAGHVAATICNMAAGDAQVMCHRIFKSIYVFHVPLWFVIAGLTFSAKDSYGVFAKKKFLRLMVPYYFWGLICALAYGLIGRQVASDMQAVATTTRFAEKTLHGAWWVPVASIAHAGGWPCGKGFCFNGVLWFLPVMFVAEMAYYWVARYVRNDSTRASIGCVAMLAVMVALGPIVPVGSPYGLNFVIRYLPYIGAGHFLAAKFLMPIKDGDGGRICYLVLCACVSCLVAMNFLPFAWFDRPLYLCKRIMRALPFLAIIMLAARLHVFRWFSGLAPMTIGIMIFHKFPLAVAQILIGKAQLSWLDSPIPVLCLCVVNVIVITSLCVAATRVVVRFAPWSLGVRSKN